MSVLPVGIAASGDEAYTIDNSVRFRSSASAYLSRTPSSAGDRKTFTISYWHKKAKNSGFLFEARNSSGGAFFALKTTGDTFTINDSQNSDALNLTTTQVFRDASSWYHIVVAIDTTQATSSDRAKLYVNGEQVTSFSTSSYPAQNADMMVNSTIGHYIGCGVNASGTPTLFIDAYLTEINFIDGQALDPTDLGETDATTGVWKPKAYSGTYGTNGFYLPTTATTQADGFNTVLYTGTGASQSISDVGFSPDLVIAKARSAGSPLLYDSVRGAGYALQPNSTGAEFYDITRLASYDADGFSYGSFATGTNASGTEYVAWCWDAGSGSPASNTDGDITSTVKANDVTGFSIVTYTGTGTAGDTIGHGLSTAPSVVICKQRGTSGTHWETYHSSIGATGGLRLNGTGATITSSALWNNTAPTSSVFSVGNGSGVNTSSGTYIAYCFSEVSGVSSFGTYTGTGTAGNSVTGLGFKPGFLMIKRTDAAAEWIIVDLTRSPFNPANDILGIDALGESSYGTTNRNIDFDDDGFTIQYTAAGGTTALNASGGTYIYMAFADTRDAQFNFDASGNKNNWTPNNINSNASSETSYDIMTDVPTLTDENTANYCTWNPLYRNAGQASSILAYSTYSNANLTVSVPTNSYATSTMKMTSGKMYSETNLDTVTAESSWGFIWAEEFNSTSITNGSTKKWAGKYHSYAPADIQWYDEGTQQSTTTITLANNDTLQWALDVDNGKAWLGVNNTWYDSSGGTTGNPSTGANPTFTLTAEEASNLRLFVGNGASTSVYSSNFGQRPFAYTPPTGFKALNTYNLPDSTIENGSEHFNTVLYTGNGTTGHAITGVGFQPDFTWIKSRSGANNHILTDAVRGATKTVFTDSTSAELTVAQALTSFDSDGFTVGYDGSAIVNQNTNAYASWNWKANGSGVSNTDGSITSTVSANTTSGFSIATFTNVPTTSGIGHTIGHGLGTTPSMVIVKNRSISDNWYVQHASLGNTYRIQLNLTSAATTSGDIWFSTSPTSSVFTIRGSSFSASTSNTFVAYCFAGVEGFSAFGSYTGNGSTDGPFIYTGFRPAWVLIKEASSTGNWVMLDTTRSTYNVINNDSLWANLSSAEGGSASYFDMLSNGFKIRDTDSDKNTSGQTYIYSAFAENPFKNSLAR